MKRIFALALLALTGCAHAPTYTLTRPSALDSLLSHPITMRVYGPFDVSNDSTLRAEMVAHRLYADSLICATIPAELRSALGTLAAPDSVWLRWTMPTRCRVPLPGGVPWRTVCAPGADGLDRVTALRVTGRVASATWRDSSARMLADAASWRRNWPQVRAEADERVILLRVYPDSLSWRMPGARDSARVARWTWYSLAVANAAGWSCEVRVAK